MSNQKRFTTILIASLLALFAASLPGVNQKNDQAEMLLQRAQQKELVDGQPEAAIQIYKDILSRYPKNRTAVAKALVAIGQCYEKLGETQAQEARKAYERVVREYADQSELAAQARVRLAALGQQPPTVTVRQVWAGAGVNAWGQPSRDGAYLTFRDPESGNLAIRDLATGQTRLLTKRQSVWESASLALPSPDGKQVAYTWYTKGFSELRVVGLDGSEPRVLYRKAGVAGPNPAGWSPDGKNVLAIVGGKEDQIVLVSVADGSVRVLKTSDWIGAARFSPDGRYIAYDLEQQPNSKECDIFLLALDTGREIPLIQHAADDEVLDWTPDGKRILFQSDRAGTWGAWLIQVADGKPQGTPELVKPDLGRGFKPLGFTRNGSYYYSVRTTRSDVYIAEIDLATGKLLAPPAPATQRFEGSNEKPDWSPDGRRLLFLSRRASVAAWAPRVLCVRSVETGEVSELLSKLDRVSWVRWSPDGWSLLAGARNAGFGIYRIDVRTGEFNRIAEMNLGWPAVWSRDGKAIFRLWQNDGAKTSSILARNLETGSERELHSIAASSFYAGGLALSRDGRQLAFVVGNSESPFVVGNSESPMVLKVMPAAGGEARDLLREAQMAPVWVAWTPDGLGLIFTRHSPGDPKTGLWLIPVQGGEPRKLELAAEGMRDLCLHPDGRHIAFTAGQDTSEVWVMENFLPTLKAAGKQ
jgi:Tol biopolymer transport system component